MARFGRFETVHEIHRTGLVVVYSAREAGGPQEKYAVKVFNPSSSVLEADIVAAESLRYLNSARIQQKVSSGSSQYWAAVYECGPSAEGDFYATDRYDRSLQKLIDGKIRLSGPVLHVIVGSIAKGLMELKEVCGRAHGNLKATNVLIAGTGDISQTQIVLSDPSPEANADTRISLHRDLRAIGKFIYELVTHRPTPAVDGWQAPDSQEWAKLGQKADDWRKFCNLLLGSAGKSETVSIETVLAEIEKLSEVKSLFSTRRLIAAVAVLIACIAVLLAVLLRPPPPPNEEDWRKLCDAYKSWVRDLRTSSNEPQTKALWFEDEQLRQLSADKLKTACYPSTVIRLKSQADIEDVEVHPEWAEDDRTQAALAAVEQIRSFFDPNSPNAWHALARMNAAANEFRDRGWERSAVYLADLVEEAKPEPNKPIIESVKSILEIDTKGVLKDIDSLLKNMAEYEKTIASSADPILVKLDSAFVVAQVAAARDVDQLSGRLADFVDLGRIIAEFIEHQWVLDVNQEAFSDDHGNDAADNPTESTFRERLDMIKGYCHLRPDPRAAISGLVTRIEGYIDGTRFCNDKEASACAETMDGLRAEIEGIRKIVPIVKNQEQMQEAISRCRPELDELLREAREALLTAFDTIEGAIELCYLLDDDMPQANRPIRSVWQNWEQASILREDSSVREAMAELKARITRLQEIEQSSDPNELIPIALDQNTETEVVYAAWRRLGGPDLPRPKRYRNLVQHRDIRDRLKRGFEMIRSINETRANHLLAKLAGTGIEYETTFIEENRSDDKALERLVQYAIDLNCFDFPSDCTRIESSARAIASFLQAENWRNDKKDKFDTALFSTETDFYNPNTNITAETFAQWLEQVKGYRRLNEDHREDSRFSWDQKLPRIKQEIDNELARNPERDQRAKLKALKTEFDDTMQRINTMRNLALIEKHREEIEKPDYYWEKLRRIERELRPEYCMRLDIDEDGRLIFSANALSSNFVPVDVNNKISLQVSERWKEIRESVKAKQSQWVDFFYTIDGNDVLNVGWPRYVMWTDQANASEGSNVILSFIPAGPGNSEPFYMTTREITNEQYRFFLEEYGAARGFPKLTGWSVVTDKAGKVLLKCTPANKPSAAIKWDDSDTNIVVSGAEPASPVTWVTFHGAQAYCAWFGGQLPNASQHKYACTAGTDDIRPWKNDSEIASYAHVRTASWREAASEWNRKKDSKVPPLPVEPIGAIKDYADPEKRILDPNAVVVESVGDRSVWPVATATTANEWGLHDMIGNVWEWCLDSEDRMKAVICGGSCVAPGKYILLESESDYTVDTRELVGEPPKEFQNQSDVRGNDIGFRVIVPAR